MTTIRDRAKHGYPFGFSKLLENLADERQYARDRQPSKPMLPKLQTHEELLAERDELLLSVAVLQAEVDRLKQGSKATRRSSYSGKQRGRQRAETVIMQKGITYYSMSHVSRLTSLHISSVSRQIDSLGIKCTVIGGIKYIPAAQASNIKKKRTRR